MKEFYEAVRRQKRGNIGWILCWLTGCLWGLFAGRWGSYFTRFPQASRGARAVDCIFTGLCFFCAACWFFETFNSLFPSCVSDRNRKKGVEEGSEKMFWDVMRAHSFDWRAYLRYPAVRLLVMVAVTAGLFLGYGLLGWQGPKTAIICVAGMLLASVAALALTVLRYILRGGSEALFGFGSFVMALMRGLLVFFACMLSVIWVLKRLQLIPQGYQPGPRDWSVSNFPVIGFCFLFVVLLTFFGDWFEGSLERRGRIAIRLLLTVAALAMIGVWLCEGVDWSTILNR